MTMRASVWSEQNGEITTLVTSDGTTGEQWIPRLEAKGYRMGEYDKALLLSPGFKPTSGLTTKLVILKDSLFQASDLYSLKVRASAEKRGLASPNPEVACLLRELLTDKDIEAVGLWWLVVMHDLIKGSFGGQALLVVSRSNNGSWLSSSYHMPNALWWDGGYGFVFAVGSSGFG